MGRLYRELSKLPVDLRVAWTLRYVEGRTARSGRGDERVLAGDRQAANPPRPRPAPATHGRTAVLQRGGDRCLIWRRTPSGSREREPGVDRRAPRAPQGGGFLRGTKRRPRAWVKAGAVGVLVAAAVAIGFAWRVAPFAPDRQTTEHPQTAESLAETEPTPSSPNPADRMVEQAAPELTLRDGSSVRPSRGAQVRLTRDEASRTELSLAQGRARFEVTPNPQRRFRVEAGPVTVEVLGTMFDVERLDEQSRVSVHRGRVRVLWEGGEVVLDAGQRGTFPPTSVRPTATTGTAPHRNGAHRNGAHRNCAHRNCAHRNCAHRNCADKNSADKNSADRNSADRNCADRELLRIRRPQGRGGHRERAPPRRARRLARPWRRASPTHGRRSRATVATPTRSRRSRAKAAPRRSTARRRTSSRGGCRTVERAPSSRHRAAAARARHPRERPASSAGGVYPRPRLPRGARSTQRSRRVVRPRATARPARLAG